MLQQKKSILALAIIAAFSQITELQAAPGKMYGLKHPFTIQDLPAKSTLRQRLESLPTNAKERGLQWLHTFDFPAEDSSYLSLDNNGGVFYIDSGLPEEASQTTSSSTSTTIVIDPANVFNLHSRPGSSKTVFLDFDGHIITGTAWNSSTGVTSYAAVAYDLDGNSADFSNEERMRIAEIWHRIAEDYSPFDIDVTTQQPVSFGPSVGRLLFTRNTDAKGVAMPSQTAGGVAYVNVFGLSSYATTYSPALVYFNQLGSGFAPYMAEAASHEFGHNLGLSHDGVIDGTQNSKCLNTTGYFCGLGTGYVSWAPIMGVGYYTNVTEWSKGEYFSANNTQDDLNIISGKLGYRPDDTGNITAGAKPLVIDTAGNITVTTPEFDPANTSPINKGVIETGTDIDVFSLDVGVGPVNITVKPAWAAFPRNSTRGANLDIDIKLYDQYGVVVASDPIDDTFATITTTLVAGRYYLAVSGIGNAVTPYSDYGSLGEYFISGIVTPVVADTMPPNPNPMSWAQAPLAQGKNSISMAASTAYDDSGVVEYQFQCLSGGSACINSAWQTSPSYTINGLSPGTSYTFAVVARDASGNVTQPSLNASATTLANQTPVAGNDNATLDEDGSITIAVLNNDSDPDNDTLAIISVGSATHGTATISGNTIIYKPVSNYFGSDTFSYATSDGFGGNASAQVTVLVNPVNDAPVANSDSAKVVKGNAVTINVLANDSDVDGDSLTLVSLTKPTKGTATILGNTVSYITGTKTGNDTFSYTVIDGKGGSRSAAITVNITR